MKLAILGATGLVGKTILRVLEDRHFSIDKLILLASEKSKGEIIVYNDKDYEISTPEDGLWQDADVALFSAGGSASLKWANSFTEYGVTVIDNSSAWRMQENIPLIVPEINAHILKKSDKIIANPNCSTIQLVMALHPIEKHFGLERVVVSTYQSVSGSGQKAVNQLYNEREGKKGEKVYPHPIDLNIIPHIDVFAEDGYTKEELKIINESRKILNLPMLNITATAVRIPVVGGHSESVNITTKKSFTIGAIRSVLSSCKGIHIVDEPQQNKYPMPIDAHKKDDVFIGRIREDKSARNAFNCWVVADNLRKGAATNAVQIAECVAKL